MCLNQLLPNNNPLSDLSNVLFSCSKNMRCLETVSSREIDGFRKKQKLALFNL
jgi:hypothetical protein